MSVNDVVYPKYSRMDPVMLNLSGFSEQRDHLYIGGCTPGATLHGMIGIKIEVISVAAAMIPEDINFFLNCIF